MRQIEDNSPVVIVDDSETDLMIARICYKRSGLSKPLVTFETGEAFLSHLDEVGARTRPMPALVLLDINMPGLSGFDVLEQTRKREQFRDAPPFVMLTNSDFQQDVDRAYELGAQGFQVKPTDMREYIAFFSSLAEAPDSPDRN